MNSKELLVKARETAVKQLELVKQIENAERALDEVKDGIVCFYVNGIGSRRIDEVVDMEKLDAIRELGLVAIMNFRDDKTAELEKLLGIRKPAIINPEFEKAVQEMERTISTSKKSLDVLSSKAKATSDVIEQTLVGILQEEAKKIEDKPIIPETSMEKYPAKKKNTNAYPEGMTKETVRKMYIDEGKTIAYIAKHFGVTYTKAANFINTNKLSRTHYDKVGKKPEKQPEETERPLQG